MPRLSWLKAGAPQPVGIRPTSWGPPGPAMDADVSEVTQLDERETVKNEVLFGRLKPSEAERIAAERGWPEFVPK